MHSSAKNGTYRQNAAHDATDETAPEEIAKARESGKVFAVKYYPAGATTNSASGVTDITKVHGV